MRAQENHPWKTTEAYVQFKLQTTKESWHCVVFKKYKASKIQVHDLIYANG